MEKCPYSFGRSSYVISMRSSCPVTSPPSTCDPFLLLSCIVLGIECDLYFLPSESDLYPCFCVSCISLQCPCPCFCVMTRRVCLVLSRVLSLSPESEKNRTHPVDDLWTTFCPMCTGQFNIRYRTNPTLYSL